MSRNIQEDNSRSLSTQSADKAPTSSSLLLDAPQPSKSSQMALNPKDAHSTEEEVVSAPSHSRQSSAILDIPKPSHRSIPPASSPPGSRQGSLRNLAWFSQPPTPTVNVFATPTMTPRTGTPADELNGSSYPFSDPNSVPPSVSELSRSSPLYNRPLSGDSPSLRYSPNLARGSFSSPPLRALQLNTSTAGINAATKERMKSSMLDKNVPLSKPWREKKDPFVLISYLLTYGCLFIGVVAGAVRCFFGWHDVAIIDGNLCPVLDQDFANGDTGVFGDGGTFLREVDMSGFGNGQFEMTTASSDNSFVRDGKLYLVPTLTSDKIGLGSVLDGYIWNSTDCTYNITQGHTYTSSTKEDQATAFVNGSTNVFDEEQYLRACSAVSNSTAGTIVNPVQSARLSTKQTASIQYGKVEIKAKLPKGDWLWPALWMLPVNDTYGPWPLSGEIDIMEARSNGPDYPHQGSNYVRGALNWGPVTWLNSVWKTYGWWTMRRGSYADDYHTYSLEWTENFMRIYVDTRLHHLLDLRVKEPFWDLGDFPATVQNGSQVVALQNPWVSGTPSAPFDKPFYLIISLGVGSTNGWFPDGPEKPWLDGSANAARDFIISRDKWLSTWGEKDEDRAFIIDSIKMWQRC